MENAEIANRIFQAYQCVEHPGNDNLLREDGQDDSVVLFLYDYDGKHWSTIDRSVLGYEYACLSALSDEGLLYVIPCFLMEVLSGNEESVDEWCYSLLNVLETRGNGQLAFTPEQFAVIDLVFLNYMKGDEEEETRRQIDKIRTIYSGKH